MRRRRVIVGLVGLALVAVVAVIFWPRGPRPCRATFEQVREGMTLEEVCATVGGPPGDYSDGYHFGLVCYDGSLSNRPKLWTADDGELCVVFAPDGRVRSVQIIDVVAFPPPTWLNQLWKRLGL